MKYIFRTGQIKREFDYLLNALPKSVFIDPNYIEEDLLHYKDLLDRSTLFNFILEWFEMFYSYEDKNDKNYGLYYISYGVDLFKSNKIKRILANKKYEKLDTNRLFYFRDGLLLFMMSVVRHFNKHYRLVAKLLIEEVLMMFYHLDRGGFRFVSEDAFKKAKRDYLDANPDIEAPCLIDPQKRTKHDSYTAVYEEPKEFDLDYESQYVNKVKFDPENQAKLKFAHLKIEENEAPDYENMDMSTFTMKEAQNYILTYKEEKEASKLKGRCYPYTDYVYYGFPDYSDNEVFQRLCYVRNYDYDALLKDLNYFYDTYGYKATQLVYFSCEIPEHMKVIARYVRKLKEDKERFDEDEFLEEARKKLIKDLEEFEKSEYADIYKILYGFEDFE